MDKLNIFIAALKAKRDQVSAEIARLEKLQSLEAATLPHGERRGLMLVPRPTDK